MLSIGRRDTALLELRTMIFGPRIVSRATCPACTQQVELEFAATDIQVPLFAQDTVLELHDQHYQIRFRLPNSMDLLSLNTDEDPALLQRRLAEGCVIEARLDDKICRTDQLPELVWTAIGEQMAAVDPHADIELALHCPTCRTDWFGIFDIVTFFWREIDAWAMQVLQDIHALASAYGWSERDILNLSDWRRQHYLELIGT